MLLRSKFELVFQNLFMTPPIKTDQDETCREARFIGANQHNLNQTHRRAWLQRFPVDTYSIVNTFLPAIET